MNLSAWIKWREARRERAYARDQARGHTIDKKIGFLAYLAETIIVSVSLVGAWMFAVTFGHNDSHQMTMMMLAPITYAVIEFFRVPLAFAVRTHPSGGIRMIALFAVICASGVTIKSVSQLGAIMFYPRLIDEVHAKEELTRALATQTTYVKHITDADTEIDALRASVKAFDQHANNDAKELAGLPPDKCSPTYWVDKDGRQYRGQTCKSDPRVKPLQENLNKTHEMRNTEATRLNTAMSARSVLNRNDVDRDVANAEIAHTEAVLHSQLHSFAAMLYGISPKDVTDAQIHSFLRIFVFFPAIFVAFTSTLIAFTAVKKVKPAMISFDPAGTDYLLGPLYDYVMEKIKESLPKPFPNPGPAGA